jgi:Ca2+-binding EF-hand superfamily protein
MGLEDEQIKVLKNCFDGFADEDGAIPADNIGNILEMMGLKGNNTAVLEFYFSKFVWDCC